MAESSSCRDSKEDQSVRRLLETNKVEAGWRAWIMSKVNVWKALADCIKKIHRRFKFKTIPSRNSILAPFRYCPKSEVKVVLVGHEPIPDPKLATGLAFSFPEGNIEADVNQPSLNELHGVLRRVYPGSPPPAETSCCHLNWARKGALLLNTALTFTADRGSRYFHRDIWIGFVNVLLQELLHDEESGMVIVFWGTNALEVYHYLNNDQKVDRHTLFMGHHPTYYIETRWHGHFLKCRNHPYTEYDDFATQAFEQFCHIEKKWPGMFALEHDVESDVINNDGEERDFVDNDDKEHDYIAYCNEESDDVHYDDKEYNNVANYYEESGGVHYVDEERDDVAYYYRERDEEDCDYEERDGIYNYRNRDKVDYDYEEHDDIDYCYRGRDKVDYDYEERDGIDYDYKDRDKVYCDYEERDGIYYYYEERDDVDYDYEESDDVDYGDEERDDLDYDDEERYDIDYDDEKRGDIYYDEVCYGIDYDEEDRDVIDYDDEERICIANVFDKRDDIANDYEERVDLDHVEEVSDDSDAMDEWLDIIYKAYLEDRDIEEEESDDMEDLCDYFDIDIEDYYDFRIDSYNFRVDSDYDYY